MAHVPLSPLGRPRDAFLDESSYQRHREAMAEKNALLEERRAAVSGGWGEKYVQRVHQKGKLTARERVEALVDEGSPVREVGTFVNHGVKFGKLESPAAGVVTAFCLVDGRWCMVIANDNTVASGSCLKIRSIASASEWACRNTLYFLASCTTLRKISPSASSPNI